jgi:hypothetical protein
MVDVFVSYSHEDAEIIRCLAENIDVDGFETWWDRKLIPGQEFDREIEKNVSNSKCVVVAWSKHSVDSRWVRAEASEALAQKKIVPAQIGDCSIPIEFRHIQVAYLAGWNGDRSNYEYRQLLSGIRNFSGHAKPTENHWQAQSSLEGETWQVESKSFEWSAARFTLARDHIKHTIEYRNHFSYEAIYVDGVEISRGGSRTVKHPMFQFYLKANGEPSICVVEPVYTAFSRIFTVRLLKLKVIIDGKLFSILRGN